jgi:hypothetical protein
MIEKDCDSVPGMATISDIFEIFIDNLLNLVWGETKNHSKKLILAHLATEISNYKQTTVTRPSLIIFK